MPSPYEAALMSYLSYEYKDAHLRLEKDIRSAKENPQSALDFEARTLQFPKQKEDIRFLFFSIMRNFNYEAACFLHEKEWSFYDSSIDGPLKELEIDSEYFGVVFINSQRKEIVIAHRGTVFGVDWISKANYKDDIELLKGENGGIPKILDNSIPFTTRVIRRRDEEKPGYTLWQTGHSLGGFIAEFGAAYVANPSPEFPLLDGEFLNQNDYFFRLHVSRAGDANAITFDSLGSINVLNKLKIPAGKANIVNYLPKPNIVNTANLHDGKRYLLLNQSQDEVTVDSSVTLNTSRVVNLDEVRNTLKSHNLEEMISRFNQNTGQPSYGYKVVIEWPSATNIFTTTKDLIIPEFEQGKSPSSSDLLKIAGIFTHGLTGGVVEFNHTRTGALRCESPTSVVTASNSEQHRGFFVDYKEQHNASSSGSSARSTSSEHKRTRLSNG